MHALILSLILSQQPSVQPLPLVPQPEPRVELRIMTPAEMRRVRRIERRMECDRCRLWRLQERAKRRGHWFGATP